MGKQIELNQPAPDFSLTDVSGNTFRLSEMRGQKHVVLVFNRGFTWPYCRRHMVQLRQDYDKFQASEAEVVAIGPDSAESFSHFWAEHDIPFVGLADPQKTVLKLYGQQIDLLKLGRMPAQAVVDVDGIVRYVHYGNSMQDIPNNAEILNLLATLSSTADSNGQ